MSAFMDGGVFLGKGKSEELYAFVKDLPIFDYHCHLSPKEICEDRVFGDLSALWLESDHYKWRIMRAHGADERLITGGAEPFDKFCAFAQALPDFIGNPVYHWAHLELKKYFGITDFICSQNAKKIWDASFEAMSGGAFSAQKLIAASNVKCVITTDDPCDDLCYHKKIKEKALSFEVLPCFRPDRAINIEKDGFCDYISALSAASGVTVDGIDSLLSALTDRLDYFTANGCVSADCSFTDFPAPVGNRHSACLALKKKLEGGGLSAEEEACFKFEIMVSLLELFASRNISVLIHTGVMRNCNSALFEIRGADAGGDSAADAADVKAARALFDRVNSETGLPRVSVYVLNPSSYYPLATLLGDFAGGERGKLQLGAAWWFCDHRDGITEQLRLTAATGGLGLFNGMLTDSRSFTAYARHDYFRRVLCSVLGGWAEAGEYPDGKPLQELAANICYYNAERYFRGDKK